MPLILSHTWGVAMTLLVAAKIPTDNLNPKRRPIRFQEKGIVMLADTRITYPGSPRREDDARKIWPVAGRALIGYTGSALTAEPALAGSCKALEEYGWDQPDPIVSAIRNYLVHFHRRNPAPRPTTVLVAVRNSVGRLMMYELSAADGFQIQLRDSVIVRGSGESCFMKQLPVEIEQITQQWSAPAKSRLKIVSEKGRPRAVPRSPTEKIPIRLIDVVTLLTGTADFVVQKAGLHSVGGLTYVRGLNKEGIISFMGKRRSAETGKWYDMTPADLRTYSEIESKVYDIPSVDELGQRC